jgi:hypothetical protein
VALTAKLPSVEEAVAIDRSHATQLYRKSIDYAKVRFVQALVDAAGDVDEAAEAIGFSLMRLYAARARDEAFAKRWDDAAKIAESVRADRMEHATAKRAIEGTPYKRYDKDGKLFEEGSVPDTAAAALMLKAYRPEKFRRKEVEAPRGGADGFATFVELVRYAAERDRLAGRTDRALPESPAIEAEVVPTVPPLVRSAP